MHLCGKFAIRTNNYKLVWKTNKLSLIKPFKITKFWTLSKFHETWIKHWSKPMHMCDKFGKRNNNYKLVRKGNKLSFIKQCKTAKFWTFSEFHKTWPKSRSRPMHSWGKFAKRNNNYKLVRKGNKLSLIKRCKILKFLRSQNSMKLDPNVGLDLCICVVNLLSVIITKS